ncbi:hypothetical protein K3177_04720 [Qipengyuania sp. GH25]|uniref:Uncharacterized protein n=1 Tax=Qipengyuania pacifica TaxID=2860199 RepID=A0ABS7JCQ7_9SPHN|nr:hypothetical protein [Qipengyuania aerophila]MBX7487810.1 hypothetical protein [Qipengyuania aerophila]
MHRDDGKAEIGARTARVDQKPGTNHQIEYCQCKQDRAQDDMHEDLPVSSFFTM